MLFAGCEVLTLWYAIEERNALYGVKQSIETSLPELHAHARRRALSPCLTNTAT